MPTRMIREGFLDSEALHQAGELAEVLFTRLMLVVDDYGRFDGRVAVITRRCWPLGGPTEVDVLERLVKLTQYGLVQTYEVEGKPFILIPKFKQRLRLKSSSKYPDPVGAYPQNDGHVPVTRPTDDGHVPDRCSPEVEVEVEVKKSLGRASRLPPEWAMPEDWKLWALKEQPTWTRAQVDRTASNFHDYWLSAPKGAKRDWRATWRIWVRKEGPAKSAQSVTKSVEATKALITEQRAAAHERADPPAELMRRFVHKPGSA